MYSNLEKESKELQASDKDPVSFAIEAIRINLCMWTYKNEVILYEAMQRLIQMNSPQDRNATEA